jgi:membrane protease YdiL (CAAX protease family)
MTPGAFLLESIPTAAISAAYTGVGEEAVYRGFMHEELGVHLGKPWATAIDTGAFLAMHLFTDMARGMEWDAIAAHLLFVGGANLLLDWAYDEGGLPLAVTCHALTDFAAFVVQDLMYRGVPQVITGH